MYEMSYIVMKISDFWDDIGCRSYGATAPFNICVSSIRQGPFTEFENCTVLFLIYPETCLLYDLTYIRCMVFQQQEWVVC